MSAEFALRSLLQQVLPSTRSLHGQPDSTDMRAGGRAHGSPFTWLNLQFQDLVAWPDAESRSYP